VKRSASAEPSDRITPRWGWVSELVKRLAEDTAPEAERVLIELWRRASPARKCEMIVSINLAGRALALAGLRARYPLDAPDQLRRRLADLWLGPELAAKAYGRFVPDEHAGAGGLTDT
jgi:hypothetical protein